MLLLILCLRCHRSYHHGQTPTIFFARRNASWITLHSGRADSMCGLRLSSSPCGCRYTVLSYRYVRCSAFDAGNSWLNYNFNFNRAWDSTRGAEEVKPRRRLWDSAFIIISQKQWKHTMRARKLSPPARTGVPA